MISALPKDGGAARLKSSKSAQDPTKEEARSLVNFSRENLTMSQSNLENGFCRKPRARPTWNALVAGILILLAFLCLGLEIWQLKSSIGNAREIKKLKRDIENLKHRMLADDIMNALKALEVVLNVEASENEDGSEMDDFDYKNYDMEDEDEDDEEEEEEDDEHTGHPADLIYGSKLSDFLRFTETPQTSTTTSASDVHVNGTDFNREVLGLLEEFEARRNHHNAGKKAGRESHGKKYRGGDNDRPADEEKKKSIHEGKGNDGNRTMQKRATRDEDVSASSFHRAVPKSRTFNGSNDRTEVFGNGDDDVDINDETIISGHPEKHPPKKYHARSRSETVQNVPSSHRNLSEQSSRRDNRMNLSRARAIVLAEGRKILDSAQVYAVHYGADYTMMHDEDEHTGNGRARHNEGVFKAWTPSDWVAELGMSRYFTLANDGKLTVHEPGLYLAYAQIHYLDEHDENGFHLLVNGTPIMQCMVYSPGVGHKSRSCFSAQVTFLHAGDRLILKDVGPARYTLFQRDKSFFGLVKLGEPRQQRHTTPSTS